jgi:hypothetical protein
MTHAKFWDSRPPSSTGLASASDLERARMRERNRSRPPSCETNRCHQPPPYGQDFSQHHESDSFPHEASPKNTRRTTHFQVRFRSVKKSPEFTHSATNSSAPSSLPLALSVPKLPPPLGPPTPTTRPFLTWSPLPRFRPRERSVSVQRQTDRRLRALRYLSSRPALSNKVPRVPWRDHMPPAAPAPRPTLFSDRAVSLDSRYTFLQLQLSFLFRLPSGELPFLFLLLPQRL